ncbi:MAG: class I tRNA ligase family protein, partial [Patescibacteria group bacterium]
MAEYNHSKIERKWQKEWAKKKIYQTKNPSSHKIAEGRGKFYVLDMFPYVSGEGIHVGHPKGYIATDVVSRKKRMEGFNVLHPMGFDSFGLPTENYAIKTKTNPVVSVAKNITRFKKQLEIIGFDYDWSREVNTSDPKFYKWTQWIFLKLLERGLAYESNEPVNWCPKDKTILANEDVEDGKCERCGTIVEKKPIRQWVLKITDYADRLLFDLDGLDWPESIKESQKNWIGRSEGAEIKFVADKHDITVFTTRSDTIFGVTFIAVSPELAKTWLDIGWEASDEVKKYITKII